MTRTNDRRCQIQRSGQRQSPIPTTIANLEDTRKGMESTFPNAALLSALTFISSRPPHLYPSPRVQPKRASVALIIWIKPPSSYSPSETELPGIPV